MLLILVALVGAHGFIGEQSGLRAAHLWVQNTAIPDFDAETSAGMAEPQPERAIRDLHGKAYQAFVQLGEFTGGAIGPTPDVDTADPRGPAEIGSQRAPMMAPKKPMSRKQFAINAIVFWLSWTVVAVLMANFVYKRQLVEQDLAMKSDPVYDMENGHFGCMEDPQSCFYSCCCPQIRWADTLSQAGFMSFWAAFSFMTILILLNIFSFGKGAFGIWSALAFLYYRQQLRSKLELPHHDMKTCAIDCCFGLWCACCLIAQEARTVKSAYEAGHEAFVPFETQVKNEKAEKEEA